VELAILKRRTRELANQEIGFDIVYIIYYYNTQNIGTQVNRASFRNKEGR